MRKHLLLLLLSLLIGSSSIYGQDAPAQQKVGFAGLHFGVVQPLAAFNQGGTNTIADEGFFAIGFPMGITFKTSGKLMVDFEFVPFINPANETTPLNTHLLFHPGVLLPLGNGFTFGARAAFELGQGQVGFTPLLNKAFQTNNGQVFFVELVLPGRFGPTSDAGYTQVVALHLGVGL